MRVIVIGAGLGGLALALGLRGAGVDVEVYERDETVAARFQGYRIGLGGPGLEALRWCVPERLHPLLHAIGGAVAGEGRMVDERLNVVGAMPLQDEGTLFDRHVLRRLLLAALPDVVRFDKRFDRYEVRPDGEVEVTFADGTKATGDLVVGADGMGSTVRRQLLPEVRIVGTGVFGAIARTPLTERVSALVPGWSTLVVGGDLKMFLGKMPFRRPPHEAAAEWGIDLPETESYLRWVLLLPPSHPRAEELAGKRAIDLLLDLTEDWHPELRGLIGEADPENSGIGEIRHGGPIELWPTGPVTLLGDAVHPMPPGGLGANLAFLDAKTLCTELVSGPNGVAEYERRMHEYSVEARGYAKEALERIGLSGQS